MKYGYVAIEGLIGAGKTTVAKALSARLNTRLVLEEFAENPFLPQFYANPERYGFSVELSFLAQRFHQLKSVSEQDLFQPLTIADYSLGKSLVFAQATLKGDELKLFKELYGIMYSGLAGPELVLYLHMPLDRVRKQIAQRGRSYERDISSTYLEQVHQHYMDHFHKMEDSRIVLLDASAHHLVNDSRVFEGIVTLLEEEHPKGVSIRSLDTL